MRSKLIIILLLLCGGVGWGQTALSDTVLMTIDFEDRDTGYYMQSSAYYDFAFDSTTSLNYSNGMQGDIQYGTPHDSTTINYVGGNFGKVMTANFPFSTFGVDGGFDIRPDLPGSYKEMYYSYDVYFKPGFIFADGGKLPGAFVGGNDDADDHRASVDPTAGWIVMFMWNARGNVHWYVYYPDMTGQYGAVFTVPDFQIETGKWYNFAYRVVINTSTGDYDAVLQFFVNGKLAHTKNDIRLKQNAADNIDKQRVNAFFGGSDECTHQTWRDEYIHFDNFALWMPDTTASGVPQGNDELWDTTQTIPIPITDVTLNGWTAYQYPNTCPATTAHTDSAGYIVYWDEHASYPNYADCDFNIEVPGADSIQLFFTSFYTEGECYEADKLYIRQTNSGGTLVETMNGVDYELPYIVNVTGDDVYMQFTSDATVQGSGIRMYYWAYEDGAMMDSTLYKEYISGDSEPDPEPDPHDTTNYEYYIFTPSAHASNGLSLSQSFTVGTVGLNQSHNIDSIAVRYYTEGSVDSVTFRLYAELNDTITGSILSRGVATGTLPTSSTMQYIDMSDYTLQASTSYVLVMQMHGSGFVFWAQDETGSYTGGMSSYLFGGTWYTESSYDCWFEVWGSEVSAPPAATFETKYLGKSYNLHKFGKLYIFKK